MNWGYSYGEFNDYFVSPTHRTPKGIKYDPSGQDISGELIDRLTDETEVCLGVPINRDAFVVKIVNEYDISCDGTQQMLKTVVKAGSEGCIEKGLLPTPECQCQWRAGIQCPNKLIVTPSMYLYKDVLIRYTLFIRDPWHDPRYAKCATPTTSPLSDGTNPNNHG